MKRELFETYLKHGVVQVMFITEVAGKQVEGVEAPEQIVIGKLEHSGVEGKFGLVHIMDTMPVELDADSMQTTVHFPGEPLEERHAIRIPWDSVVRIAGYNGSPPTTSWPPPWSNTNRD